MSTFALVSARRPPDGRDELESQPRQRSLRVTLTWTLGVIWIFDGLLQLQPAQFGANFALGIEMNAMAQPGGIAHLELLIGRFIGAHAAPWTLLVAVIQILLGSAMLVPRSRRTALVVSIAWALAVWVVGEGLGSIATGFALIQTGAPGAALVYAMIAGALVVDLRGHETERLRLMLRGSWSLLWVLATSLQLASPVARSLVLRANFNEGADGEPAVFASLDHHLANFTSAHATGVTALLATIDICLALLPWLSSRRLALQTSLAALAVMWVAGENFGSLFTYAASDIGIAPMLGLIAIGSFSASTRSAVATRTDGAMLARSSRRIRRELTTYAQPRPRTVIDIPAK